MAQKMLQTSWMPLMAFRTLMGKAPFISTTKVWPQERASELFVAASMSSASFPSVRTRQSPLASEKAMPNFAAGCSSRHDFIEIFDRLDEVALP